MINGPKNTAPRRGSVLIYTMVLMITLTGFGSLAVDYARVQMVKTQLLTAVDAATRAGATGFSVSTDEAIRRAVAAGGKCKVDGSFLIVDQADIQVGTWDVGTRRFTRANAASYATATAIRIVGKRISSRGTHVRMSLAKLLGYAAHDVQREAIAVYTPGLNMNQSVQATANPFLSGMPTGTVASLHNPHNSPDFAGDAVNARQSPVVAPFGVSDGQTITFDTIGGTARHDPNLAYYQPDGDLRDIGHNTNGSEHGISDMHCPINALVGVFMSDDQPDRSMTPSSLDFSTAASRDFSTLKPQLKQLFFIGDGMDSHRNHQNFIAPAGATRLFLATWDFYEWNNNAGVRIVQINRPGGVKTVK